MATVMNPGAALARDQAVVAGVDSAGVVPSLEIGQLRGEPQTCGIEFQVKH
ncbi:MAG: hypothetical protein JSR96_00890 [Proteobacteria bacterium]|nr:hypothetical protein [Pseudomonadota bacterium]